MKALINLIVFVSLISFTIISCTKDDKNIEITDSIINLDTSTYAYLNNVELDLRFSFQSPPIKDTLYIIEGQDTLEVLPFNYKVKFDLSDQQFEQSQTNTTDLYTRQVAYNANVITNDTLFIDDGIHLVPNYMYITQEPATNIINVYSHYVTPSFTYDLYIYNHGTDTISSVVTQYDYPVHVPPSPRMPAVNFHNVDYPFTSTIDYSNNAFSINGSILYAGQQTSNCVISENYNTIVGDFTGTIKVTYMLHYIDTKYDYTKEWTVVEYAEIENGELLMTETEF